MIAVISANSELMKLAILVSTSNTLSPPFYVYSVLYFRRFVKGNFKKNQLLHALCGCFFRGENRKRADVCQSFAVFGIYSIK